MAERAPILLIDDDPDIRDALGAVLEDEGHPVVARANGRDALEYLRAGEQPRPSLILLDLMMPIMDGWQFRKEQKEDPELAKIPVIVISAVARSANEELGAQKVISKPIELDKLLGAVKTYSR